jgi:HSP20 family protein
MLDLIPWRKSKDQPLTRLRSKFESLFDRLFSESTELAEAEPEVEHDWGLDVEDRDDEVVVRAEVPGFEPDELDVQVSGRLLTISAQNVETGWRKGNGYSRRAVAVQRVVKLPEGVDSSRIAARLRNGILNVHLPKVEPTQRKRVAIEG